METFREAVEAGDWGFAWNLFKEGRKPDVGEMAGFLAHPKPLVRGTAILCLAALARLGDAEARAEFVRRLHASKSDYRERALFLERAEYVAAPWLLPELLPILDDEERTLQGAHMMTEQGCEEIGGKRACDQAVELAEALSGRSFPFSTERPGFYSPAEIEEVRAFLRTLRAPTALPTPGPPGSRSRRPSGSPA
jgi:HEAT repeat protein